MLQIMLVTRRWTPSPSWTTGDQEFHHSCASWNLFIFLWFHRKLISVLISSPANADCPYGSHLPAYIEHKKPERKECNAW